MIITQQNDEIIIARSHDGDDAATDFLLEKYKPLVKKKARTLFLIGGDNDDLIQEGMLPSIKPSVLLRQTAKVPSYTTLLFALIINYTT